jgi:hypothetical protein
MAKGARRAAAGWSPCVTLQLAAAIVWGKVWAW